MTGTTTPSAAGLEVTGLSLAFGGLKALTDVSFLVVPGSITAVIEPGTTKNDTSVSAFNPPKASDSPVTSSPAALGVVVPVIRCCGPVWS